MPERLDMPPDLAEHNATNRALVDPVLICQPLLADVASGVTGSDVHNGFGRKLASGWSGALAATSQAHVFVIVRSGPFGQVGRVLARRVIAGMARVRANLAQRLSQFQRQPVPIRCRLDLAGPEGAVPAGRRGTPWPAVVGAANVDVMPVSFFGRAPRTGLISSAGGVFGTVPLSVFPWNQGEGTTTLRAHLVRKLNGRPTISDPTARVGAVQGRLALGLFPNEVRTAMVAGKLFTHRYSLGGGVKPPAGGIGAGAIL